MKAELLVGATVAANPENVLLDRDVLTTHGVILGMTGSGKTGLAIVLLEELARKGVPLVICDLKGDMTNLLLNFPGLAATDFKPWLPVTQAAGDRDAAATAVAAKWRDGLAKWELGPEQMREVRSGVAWRLLTPGSGVAPVSLLPALAPPVGYDPDVDPDGARARLDGTAAGLLALVGRGGDPLSDRDHVLVATLLDASWRKGTELSLSDLVKQVADPPVSQFGVLDAESFYPRRERQELLLAFNTVLASPAFGAWTRGVPLAIEELIGAPGAPRATVLYLAHLADRERLSFLTLLFSTLLSWVRSQPGSDALRVLLYLDEVQGILPPTAMPPTKPPLLTLLKQGRAFGAGVLLATQNPVDLDYKALGNIGLKLVGRLDTENDRRRALEGLDVSDATASDAVAGLQQRQFLLAGARVGAPRVIGSRWAMSYLRGPLALPEVKAVVGAPAAAPAGAATMPVPPPPAALLGIEQLYGRGARLAPHVLVEADVVYRKTSLAIERRVKGWWSVPFTANGVAWEKLRHVDLELAAVAPPGAALERLPGDVGTTLKGADRRFCDEMDSRALEVEWHRDLNLVRKDDQLLADFEEQCRKAAPQGAGKEADVRARFEQKIRRVKERLAREQLELAGDEREAAARSREKTFAVATGLGATVLSAIVAAVTKRRGAINTTVRRGASTMQTYSSKDRMADRADAEVEESRQSIEQLEAERQRLVQEMGQELATLQQTGASSGIETLRITPARKDITVYRVALGWLPEGSVG